VRLGEVAMDDRVDVGVDGHREHLLMKLLLTMVEQ
jgi:hypothetical protein